MKSPEGNIAYQVFGGSATTAGASCSRGTTKSPTPQFRHPLRDRGGTPKGARRAVERREETVARLWHCLHRAGHPHAQGCTRALAAVRACRPTGAGRLPHSGQAQGVSSVYGGSHQPPTADRAHGVANVLPALNSNTGLRLRGFRRRENLDHTVYFAHLELWQRRRRDGHLMRDRRPLQRKGRRVAWAAQPAFGRVQP